MPLFPKHSLQKISVGFLLLTPHLPPGHLFNFYLRTTAVLDFTIKEIAFHTWSIKLNNFFMPLPIDITTDAEMQKMVMEKTV